MGVAVLHGSGIGRGNISDLYFIRTIVANVPHTRKTIKVLSIPYACHENAAADLVNFTKACFSWAHPDRKFNVLSASQDAEALTTQIAWADVLYAHGGNGDLIVERFPHIPNLEYLLRHKVISGGSAGTNVWARGYYSNDNQAVNYGLDVIPVYTFCHYQSWKWNALNLLIETARGENIIPISDDGHVVFEF